MRYHRLKIWSENYIPLVEGRMTCQLRRSDRDFRVADYLMLREYQRPPPGHSDGHYTNRWTVRLISHIDGPFHVKVLYHRAPAYTYQAMVLLSVTDRFVAPTSVDAHGKIDGWEEVVPHG